MAHGNKSSSRQRLFLIVSGVSKGSFGCAYFLHIRCQDTEQGTLKMLLQQVQTSKFVFSVSVFILIKFARFDGNLH